MTETMRSPVHDVDPAIDAAAIAAPLLPFLRDRAVVTIHHDLPGDERLAPASQDAVHAVNVLQDVADYRGVIRHWFAMLRVGGRLAIEVPHAFLYDRSLVLPSHRHPMSRRLYTPASLLAEIEEALEPNSYRVRLACDHDEGVDYRGTDPEDAGAVLLVLERIAPPAWDVDIGEVVPAHGPDFAFEPARTRREIAALAPRRRIIILKLDHLGDFIMGIPALERARAAFADADITLVVGPWNESMACQLGLADAVIPFDAFPRNSTEEKVNLGARTGDFERLLVGHYDLAIDLRVDPDTRFFLDHLRADIRAGIGTRAQFGFLDIFLPIDGSRHGFEAASERRVDHHGHAAAPACRRSPHRIAYDPGDDDGTSPFTEFIIFGPYIMLDPGEYIYEPFIDIGGDGSQMLMLDVACDLIPVTRSIANAVSVPRLRFTVEKAGTRVEFRIRKVVEHPTPDFAFYGGRLLKRGANSVLHQSEYCSLLIDLVATRMDRFGVLREETGTS